jgi:Na+/H+ antiporter NhaD/arsenite permease-like protein
MIDFLEFAWMGLGRLLFVLAFIAIPYLFLKKYQKLRQNYNDLSKQHNCGRFPSYAWRAIKDRMQNYWVYLILGVFLFLLLVGEYRKKLAFRKEMHLLRKSVELGEMTPEQAREYWEQWLEDRQEYYDEQQYPP